MLFELKIYYKDGHISHDLIVCDSPLILEGNSVITNLEKRLKFITKTFNDPIIKIEKKCVLACKTKNFKQHGWCSGNGYVWPDKWWKMV
jgi:hypothetical protein